MNSKFTAIQKRRDDDSDEEVPPPPKRPRPLSPDIQRALDHARQYQQLLPGDQMPTEVRIPRVKLFVDVVMLNDSDEEQPATETESIDTVQVASNHGRQVDRPATTAAKPVPIEVFSIFSMKNTVTSTTLPETNDVPDTTLLITKDAAVSRRQLILPAIVRWTEPKEINKATHLVCKHRVLKGEFFPHPLLYDKARERQRSKSSLDRNRATTMQVVNERVKNVEQWKKLCNVSHVTVADAIRRYIDTKLYKYSSEPRERLLINKDFSNGMEVFPVQVFSDVLEDNREPMPSNFEYISENTSSKDFSEDKSLTFSCDCKETCGKDCVCYQADRRLFPSNLYNASTRHFETLMKKNVYDQVNADAFYVNAHVMCGKACSCSSSCSMKYPPEASHKFEIFKRNSEMGFGLRVLNNIRTGEFVSEFLGECSTMPKNDEEEQELFSSYSLEVSDTSLKHNDKQYGRLMKLCSEIFVEKKEIIRRYKPSWSHIMPYYKGNVSRFVAHGCLPNITIMRIIVNDLRPEAHHIFFVAVEDIPAGTEIMFDYGPKYFRAKKNLQCLCEMPLCSNKKEVPFLAKIMEHMPIENIWKIIEQRTMNNERLSRFIADAFAYYEYARSNGQPDPPAHEFTSSQIKSQVENLIEELKQIKTSKHGRRDIKLCRFGNVKETPLVSNRNWPQLLPNYDEVLQIYESYVKASIGRKLPGHPEGPLLSPELLKDLIFWLFAENIPKSSPDLVEIIDLEEGPSTSKQAPRTDKQFRGIWSQSSKNRIRCSLTKGDAKFAPTSAPFGSTPSRASTSAPSRSSALANGEPNVPTGSVASGSVQFKQFMLASSGRSSLPQSSQSGGPLERSPAGNCDGTDAAVKSKSSFTQWRENRD